jgi:hypothetical protein
MNNVILDVSLQTSRSVTGVTQLDDFLYVVCSEFDVIQVFSSKSPFNHVADIVVPGMDDANDIAVCCLTRHLYIADWGYHCIWKLSQAKRHTQWVDTGAAPLRWVTSISPWALSVNRTQGGRVLVTPRVVIDERHCKRANLFIFEADGSLIDDISLPEAVNPEHAVETPRLTVVVCYTKRQAMADGGDCRSAGICELERSGCIIRRFEDSRKETLLWPRHIAIVCSPSEADGNFSCTTSEPLCRLVVTDFSGGRVLLFNERLEIERIVLSAKTDQIDQPRRIFTNSAYNKLVLGQFNGTVSIYSFSSS